MNTMDIASLIKANEQSLTKQSRSFSIPILKLTDPLRLPIMVQYNLNKTLDTIEDNESISIQEKQAGIEQFIQALNNGHASQTLKAFMLAHTPKAESYVFHNYDTTIALFNHLSDTTKTLGLTWTTLMANGMRDFLTREINTHEDLNDYCYIVAGSVGIYLTKLLHAHAPQRESIHWNALEKNAVGFGLFLQKLNIIRDYKEDKTNKGRSFWPSDFLRSQKAPIDSLNHLCDETLKNDATRAIDYLNTLPEAHPSFEYFLRYVLSSGLEYLKILRNNKNVFSTLKVKLPKPFIQHLYQRVAKVSKAEFSRYLDETYTDLL